MEDERRLREILTPLQYRVMRENGTEPPFRNEYHDLFAPGIYVDRISGEPLFSSLDKFDHGCGWPSFAKPIGDVTTKIDRSFFMVRTEVRAKGTGSHLGHVFDDGPEERGGRRYCINSAALRFIPEDRLEAEGYGAYRRLFGKKEGI